MKYVYINSKTGEKLYVCDPTQNILCTKENCYLHKRCNECYMTSDRAAAKEFSTDKLLFQYMTCSGFALFAEK